MTGTVTRTDDVPQSAVIEELEWDPSLNSIHLGVSVSDGAVTLSGESDTYPERLAAEKAAQRVRGVNAVARLESDNISIGADPDGVVTLTGTVNSWAEARKGEQVAWSAPGVTGITNRLVVAA